MASDFKVDVINTGIVLRVVQFWSEIILHTSGAPKENIVQNHLNIALLNVF